MKTARVLLLLLYCFPAFRQDIKPQKLRYSEVPREQVLLVLAQQPNSPLSLEAPVCLKAENGKEIIRYKVRNVSSKAVVEFTVVAWDSGGAGGTLPLILSRRHTLQPGDVMDSMDEGAEIAHLSHGTRKKSKILRRSDMRQIYFLLVDQVRFADGTAYSDQAVSRALSDYLSKHTCPNDR